MNIKLTSFEESEEDVRSVRDTVFGEEQKVPRELDWDGSDPDCVHVLVTSDDGRPIGTGRVQPDGRIGRLAVLRSWRGQGIGGKMLETLVESARSRGLRQAHLHAQIHAIPFYEEAGFRQSGDEFEEAGIMHINMTKGTQQSHAEATDA